MPRLFHDRRDAGRQLAAQLRHFEGRSGVIVLGLPRGGIPVAFEVAHELGVPLDVFTVRKLGLPGHEEFAFGAIASGGVCVLDDTTLRDLHVSASTVAAVRAREEVELERRERLFRGERPPIDVHGSTVIVVDDGLATGATMRAAVTALRTQSPTRIIVAAPVGSVPAVEQLSTLADDCFCLAVPASFLAVGAWYDSFDQTSDAEVHRLLDLAMSHLPEDARLGAIAAHGML